MAARRETPSYELPGRAQTQRSRRQAGGSVVVFTRSILSVGRVLGWGYPNGHRGEPAPLEGSPPELLVDMGCNVFGGRRKIAERRKVVQVLMVQRIQDGVERLLDIAEIHQHTVAVQLIALIRDDHAVVVPVQLFAGAVVVEESVRAGDGFLDADLEHSALFYPTAQGHPLLPYGERHALLPY